jgi:two-component system chemotaxis response regulator CheY
MPAFPRMADFPHPEEGGGSSRKLPLTILYAEDMPELRDVARVSLSRDGHTVDVAEDGVVALEKVTAAPGRFHVVITDHHMPRMNGVDLVRQLRAMAYPGKIVIFSSELSRDVNNAYRAMNVDRILYKPIFPAELRRVLEELHAPAEAARALGG